jgi:hypothetical protein
MYKTPSEILAIENLTFDKPTPLNPNSKKNPKKYCEFHRDHGHDANSCWKLQRQIEQALQSGQLAHLVKEIKTGKQTEDRPPKPIKDVNVITGSSIRMPDAKQPYGFLYGTRDFFTSHPGRRLSHRTGDCHYLSGRSPYPACTVG